MKKNRSWKKLSSRVAYENKWMELIEDEVKTPEGQDSIYGYLKKGNGNFIIPMDDEGNIYLIEEYRYPIGCSVIQLVAGCHDDDEELLSAKKELYQETGLKAAKWERLGAFYQAPGFCTVCDPIYLATDLDTTELKTTSQEGDESILRIIKASVTEVKSMLRDGKINCAMSAAGLNLLFLKLDQDS